MEIPFKFNIHVWRRKYRPPQILQSFRADLPQRKELSKGVEVLVFGRSEGEAIKAGTIDCCEGWHEIGLSPLGRVAGLATIAVVTRSPSSPANTGDYVSQALEGVKETASSL